MAKILVLDDEPEALAYWWDDLEDAGYTLVRTTTVEDALLSANADNYDLMILDRMLPPGDVYGTNIDPADKRVGSSIMSDFRGRCHLEEVPIIFLTNYPSGDDADALRKAYDRVEVVSKGTTPSLFTRIVERTLAEVKVQQRPPDIPDDEYPDVAPYHVSEVGTERRNRVYFERCTLLDGTTRSPTGFNTNWELFDVFDHWLRDEATCHKVHKLKSVDAPELGLMGLYWSGSDRSGPEWYRNVLFVAAPWLQHGNPIRKFKGVGEVMVARYLREWMWRQDLPATTDLDPTLFSEHGVEIEGATGGNRFLEEICFKYDVSRKVYIIDQHDAYELLKRVTYYSRAGHRRKNLS